MSCFFFQAEDGIRDGHVTGVQTCALPISEAFKRLKFRMFAGIRGQLSTVVRSFSLLEAFRSYLSRSLKCSLRKTSSNSPISSSEGTDLALGLDMRRTAGNSEIFSRSSSTASHAVRIGSPIRPKLHS